MLRRWCIPLAGLALVGGALAASAPAAAASRAGHPVRPTIHVIYGTRPMIWHGLTRTAVASQNWSGYAAHSTTYHSVSANWTQPAVHCSGGDTFSAFWVGLDGYLPSSRSVEQTGSSGFCQGGGPVYFGWYEMFPAGPHNYGDPVSPGDHFHASVTFTGNGGFNLTLTDSTAGWSHTVHKTLSGAHRSSAEIIAEAPCCTGSGNPLPLANFGTIHFSNASVNGASLGSSGPTQIIMVNGSGRPKDSVSGISGGTAFSIHWLHST